MGQRIKPAEVKIVTKDGECYVNIQLELTINLKSDGLSIASTGSNLAPEPKEKEKERFAIPDFKSMGMGKVKFGKTGSEEEQI